MWLDEIQCAQNVNAADFCVTQILRTVKFSALVLNVVKSKSMHDFPLPVNTKFCSICNIMTLLSMFSYAPHFRQLEMSGAAKSCINRKPTHDFPITLNTNCCSIRHRACVCNSKWQLSYLDRSNWTPRFEERGSVDNGTNQVLAPNSYSTSIYTRRVHCSLGALSTKFVPAGWRTYCLHVAIVETLTLYWRFATKIK